MTITALRTEAGSLVRSSRAGGWVLVASPLGFVALLGCLVGVFANAGIQRHADITHGQMTELGAGWLAAAVLQTMANLVGTVGIALVAHPRLRSAGRRWAIAALVLAAAATLYTVAADGVLRGSLVSFRGDVMGDDPRLAFYLGTGGLNALAYAATAALAAAEAATGPARVTPLVIAGVATVLGLAVALGVLVPPFAIALLWVVIGIRVLRSTRRPAEA